MERRDFFKFGAKKAAKVVYDVISERAVQRATNWFRPPFAVAEMDFLIDCTRCDKCIAACEHEVLFKLAEKYGAEAAGTPAMDLLNKGCHLCIDWPCVTVCEPGVLVLPKTGGNTTDMEVGVEEGTEAEIEVDMNIAPPKLAIARIDEDTCLPYSGPECGACSASCPVPGALTWQDSVKPVINETLCTDCALCREACITHPKSISIGVVPIIISDDSDETREITDA